MPSATHNFERFPWAWGVVAASVLAIANIPRAVFHQKPLQAFASSSLTLLALMALFGLAQFPNLLASSTDAAHSLTIYSASSSHETLAIMAWVALLGMPFVLTYTAVVYWIFRGKVKLTPHSY